MWIAFVTLGGPTWRLQNATCDPRTICDTLETSIQIRTLCTSLGTHAKSTHYLQHLSAWRAWSAANSVRIAHAILEGSHEGLASILEARGQFLEPPGMDLEEPRAYFLRLPFETTPYTHSHTRKHIRVHTHTHTHSHTRQYQSWEAAVSPLGGLQWNRSQIEVPKTMQIYKFCLHFSINF